MVQLTKENLIYIGASGTIAVAALALIGSSIFSGATTEGLEIGETSIKKASGNAVITIQVKNVGTSEAQGLTVTVNGIILGTANPADDTTTGIDYPAAGDGDCTTANTGCNIEFIQNPNIDAGQTVSFSATIKESKDSLNVGDSFVVVVTGQVDSNDVTATAVATVTRF